MEELGVPVRKVSPLDLELVLSHTAPLWGEMRGQSLFLTGGTGFFGCWLVESFCYINRLLGLGAEMTILTRDPEAFAQKCPHLASDPAVTLHAGDVRNFVFPDREYRCVIHAATETRARKTEEAPLEMLSTIIAHTKLRSSCSQVRELCTAGSLPA
jgi:dTDP-glucose 4,6-dehydratase